MILIRLVARGTETLRIPTGQLTDLVNCPRLGVNSGVS